MPYVLAALMAFAGGAVLLKGIAVPAGGAAGPGLLSDVVAALLVLTGAILLALAAAKLIHARESRFRRGDR